MSVCKSEAQECILRLMELGSYNEFDGEAVAESLRQHAELWDAALFTRLDSLILLRDLPGMVNLDTLYLRPAPGKEAELEALANTWGADELEWIGGREAGHLLGSGLHNGPRVILRIWWD